MSRLVTFYHARGNLNTCPCGSLHHSGHQGGQCKQRMQLHVVAAIAVGRCHRLANHSIRSTVESVVLAVQVLRRGIGRSVVRVVVRVLCHQSAFRAHSPSVKGLVTSARAVCVRRAVLLQHRIGDSRQVVAHEDGRTFAALFTHMTPLAQHQLLQRAIEKWELISGRIDAPSREMVW